MGRRRKPIGSITIQLDDIFKWVPRLRSDPGKSPHFFSLLHSIWMEETFINLSDSEKVFLIYTISAAQRAQNKSEIKINIDSISTLFRQNKIKTKNIALKIQGLSATRIEKTRLEKNSPQTPQTSELDFEGGFVVNGDRSEGALPNGPPPRNVSTDEEKKLRSILKAAKGRLLNGGHN